MRIPQAVRDQAEERASREHDYLLCEAQILIRDGNVSTSPCMGYAGNCHHRINRSVGGGYALSSLLMLCGSGTTGCHGWVTHNPTLSRDFGWAIRSTDDPRAMRVLYRGRWALLGDDGSVNYESD